MISFLEICHKETIINVGSALLTVTFTAAIISYYRKIGTIWVSNKGRTHWAKYYAAISITFIVIVSYISR